MEHGEMIEELTAEQEIAVGEVGRDWAAIGAATGPADAAAAEDGVRAAYRAVGMPPPRFIVWLDSPWAGLIGQAILPSVIASVTGGRPARVRARFHRRLRGQLPVDPGGLLAPGIGSRIEEQVTEAVGRRVDDAVLSQELPRTGWRWLAYQHMGSQVSAQHRGAFEELLQSREHTARLDLEVLPRVYGELTAQVAAQAGARGTTGKGSPRLPRRWWRGAPLTCRGVTRHALAEAMERIGVTGLSTVHGEQQVARHAGWWWAFRDYAVLTPRPDAFHRDAQGRPHCSDGPAAVWPDGWAVHVWHGTRVPASLIRDGWDTDRILQEPNTEIRRCAIERMGWPEFIAAAGLRQVGDSAPDPGNPGQRLALYDLPAAIDNVPVRVLLCTNATPERDGTRRSYGLTVPAETPDPVSAAAGLLGLTRDQYLTVDRAT